MREFKFLLFIIILTLLVSSISVAEINQKNIKTKNVKNNDFYFVQITDTHIKHKIFDLSESTTKKLNTVLNKINSFGRKPAFIVVTGDLCEWAGSDPTGALNCQTFISCFYENNGQFFADENFSIPVYTIPGNHEYNFDRSLGNYHNYIDNNHLETEDKYIINHGDLTLFFMNSGPNYYANPFDWFDVMGDGLYDRDISWLENSLKDCTSQNKIVLMHHPAINDRNENGEMHNVIARNRLEFIDLCENHNVDVVLTGHTHRSVIFDKYENKSYNPPINCSNHSTLYLQTDDCKQGINYRNISIIGQDVWIEKNIEVQPTIYNTEQLEIYENIYFNISNKMLLISYKMLENKKQDLTL